MQISRYTIGIMGLVGGMLIPAMALAQEPHGREDVLAVAPDDIAPDDVGRLFTRDFAPLVGGTNSVLPADGQGVRVRSRDTTDRQLRVVQSASELRANARVWGLGSASIGASSADHHAFFRALSVDRIHQMDDRFAIPAVPEGAEWYISAVYVGRLYEVHFSSAQESLAGRIGASMLGGDGSIEAFAGRLEVNFRARTIGLVPRSGDALFASSASEMQERYAATGEPRPILVRYSRVPRSARPQVAANRPRRVTLVSVQFPDRNPSRNTAWDPLGGAPDILVRVIQGGSQLLDRFGGRDANPVTLDALVGEALVVSPENPLVFTFSDRDMVNHDDAGQLMVASLPEEDSAQFRPPPGTRGVQVVLRVETR